jgi:hypothetical protein
MAEEKDNKRKNGKLSLYPLKFEETVKALLLVKHNDIPNLKDGKKQQKVEEHKWQES